MSNKFKIIDGQKIPTKLCPVCGKEVLCIKPAMKLHPQCRKESRRIKRNEYMRKYHRNISRLPRRHYSITGGLDE